MRLLVEITFPNEPFNTLVREGTIGQKIGAAVEATGPKSIYFTEHDGQRGASAVYELNNDSEVPRVAEPWYLAFNATCRFRVAMTPDDLGKANLDTFGKRW